MNQIVLKSILRIMSVEEITSLLDSPNQADKDFIKKAYDFALKAHEGPL